VLVIRLGNVPFIDATGLQAFEEAVLDLQARGVRVIVVEANPRVYGKLRKMGLIDKLGPQNVAQTLIEVILPLQTRQEPAGPV
jgi:SulP family sulfate permease